MIHADRHICKESRVVLQSLENTGIFAKKVVLYSRV